MNIALLLTGDELIRGDILDTNSRRIADQLTTLGFLPKTIITVGDNLAHISSTLTYLAISHDLIIVNGGLGPTIDDLTAEAFALASKTRLREHPEAIAHLTAWCQKRKIDLNEKQRKQAQLPEHASILHNALGSAPGFYIQLATNRTLENNNTATQTKCFCIATPGVPIELESMLTETIIPLLKQRFNPQNETITEKLDFFGLGESELQSFTDTQLVDPPKTLTIGFRIHFPMVELKLTAPTSAMHLLQTAKKRILAELGHYLISEQSTSMAAALIRTLKTKNKRMTTAESCTGGLVSHLICSEPGASQVFPGGIVTYANETKQQLIGVPEQDLIAHGAVSEPVAKAMLQGALQRFSSDYGVALTGIAGPSGGSEDKPVGLVYIAWGSTDEIKVQSFYLNYDRTRFQKIAAHLALDLLRRFILGVTDTPQYFKRFA